MTATPRIISTRSGSLSLIPAGADRFVDNRDGVAWLLDTRLDAVDAREIEGTRVLAALGLECLVVSDGADTTILSDRIVIVPDVAGDSAWLVGDLVVATAPSTDGHRILLIDATTGDVLDEKRVDAEDASAVITPHPSDPVVVITLPMGQDGCIALRVEVVDRRLRVEEVLPGRDPVIAGFNPSGTRVLVTPYPSDPEAAYVLAWPSLEEIARLTADDLGAERGIGLAGCWLDDDRIALVATEDALVLTDGLLRDPERVGAPLDLGDEGDIESLTTVAPGRVAATLWASGERSTLVFEV